MAQAAISASTPTHISVIIAPYPTSRMSASLASSLGVVPEATRQWKPLIAPQAIVMKQKGKTGPAKMGPVPSIKRVSAGISSCGASKATTTPKAATVPIFKKELR